MSKIVDPEITAMETAGAAIESLEPAARSRVLTWLLARYGNLATDNPSSPAAAQEISKDSPMLEISSFSSASDLFGIASPSRDVDKVLLVSAFLQEKQQKTDLTGLEINRELHNLGHRVSNVTNTITHLMKGRPQLMIQTKKEGTSKQAKKKYRVSAEGLRRVRENFVNGRFSAGDKDA